MLALVAAPEQEGRVTLAEVAEPEVEPHEALIEVHTVSVNRGEWNRLLTAKEGWRPGWDIGGVISQAAADGSGPATGTRVVALKPSGAWAQRVAVPTDFLAPIPDRITYAEAASLPVAGVTALRLLRLAGSILGRSVLVTGAAGGVGSFTIQLGRRAGASIVALVGRQQRGQGLLELGAVEVAVGLDAVRHRMFDCIFESSGGDTLARALQMLQPDGLLVTFGNSSREDTTFRINDFYAEGGRRMVGFFLFHELNKEPPARDLALLADEVAEGRLLVQIGLESPWEKAGEALLALSQRQVAGKAVLHLHQDG